MVKRKKPDLRLVQQALAQQSLVGFIYATCPYYLMGWVHEEVCAALDAFLLDVMEGRSPRLMITMPPRSGKSEIASRRFPAYALGRNPDLSIIATSYSADLASRMNRDVQRIIESEEYRAIFPGVHLPGKNSSQFRTSDFFEVEGHNGGYRSAGVGGGITGMGGNILLLDDVLKDRASADSPTIRQNIWDWYTSTLYTRLAPGGGIIVIQTRWHPVKDDTPVLTTKGWKTHGELVPGDQVYGLNGKPVNITHVGEPVWCDMEIVTRQESVVCAKTHLWPCKTRPEHNPVNVTAEKLATLKDRSLPLIAPIEYPAQTEPLPIDPYWLGLWLGNGSKSAPTIIAGKHYTAHYESTPYAFRKVPKDKGDWFYHYTHQGLRGKLAALNLLYNKHIPECYLRASVHDRLELLAGLIDTDGDLAQHKWYRFASTSPELLGGAVELVRSLGFNASRPSLVNVKGSMTGPISGGKSYERKADCYRFSFIPSPDWPVPCRVEYKKLTRTHRIWARGISARLADHDKCGWGRCITTDAPDGLYLVGRTLIPTHNCDDLAGRLLEAQRTGQGDKWQVINFPAIAEQDEPHRKQGEALHPERYSLEQLHAIRAAIGSRDWEALYQQHPTPDGGGIFKAEWLRFWLPKDLPQNFERMLISWDMTFKDGDDSDFVVGQVWGKAGANFYLLDQVRGRMGFTATLAAFQALARKWPQAQRKLVEDKANGPAVIDCLRNTVPGIIPVEPDGSKVARAHAVTTYFEAGNVHIPHPSVCGWVSEYVAELTQFPAAAHDDQVDATTQALRDMQTAKTLTVDPSILRRGATFGRMM